MRYRTFPNTGVTVSELGFGLWTLSTGWWGEKSDAEAVALLRAARDEHGITFFDAADTYGDGRSERQLAEAFRGRRADVVIGTKIGYDIYDRQARDRASRAERASAALRAGRTCALPSTNVSSGWRRTTSTCSSCTT